MLFNDFEDTLLFIINYDNINELLNYVKFDELKISYKVFHLLLKYKCKLGLMIFGKMKYIIIKLMEHKGKNEFKN